MKVVHIHVFDSHSRLAALAASALALFMATFATADTIAWWHFDECDPGTTAPADTVASDQAPTTYAHVYTIGTSSAMSTTVENGGDYLPTYAKPFHGLAVYDPVSDTTRTNHAAMKYRVERGGPNPNSNGGRARFGGGLKFDGGYDLYQPLYGTSALTVEAFVCTTGGVYNTFAPIVGSLGGTSWTSERWALYMESSGTVAVRLAAGSATDVWYSGNSAGGKNKVNDGAWHHVAFTYDGSYVRIYVDYVLDKKSDDSNRVHGKTGTIPTYSGDTATWIGGYAYGSADNGGRKFPGVIDEVRVSNAVLTPDQFLRMQPLDMDPDEIARVSFVPDEYGTLLKRDYADIGDAVRPNCQDIAVFRKVSDAGPSVYDTETKAGSIMAAKSETDIWFDDVASFYQETNGVGKANYVQMPYISKLIRGNDGAAASYTVEMFYKTRKTVRGTTNNRQVLMKFGGDGYFNVLFNATDSRLLYVSNTGGADSNYDAASSNADDGKWHHVAVVVDGAAGSFKFYFDYALARTRSGTLADVSTGKSLFFGARDGGTQCFDGWIDDIRVTRRALTPDEFLTTHPVGSDDASLLALFENNYNFTCAQYADFSVTGSGEARTGGNAPTFVRESRGAMLLDGTNGSMRVRNQYSAHLNGSRVVFPPSPLFEAGAYTVEFWAKLDGIVDANGSVDAGSTNLAQHVPIMRLSKNDNSDYDWYIYRQKNDRNSISMAIGGQYPGWAPSSRKLIVDGNWHHYAFTFEPVNNGTNTLVKFFYDYRNVGYGSQSKTGVTLGFSLPRRVTGHRLMLGEGSNPQPNIVGEFDALRFSKGVLAPWQFLGREGSPFMLIVR